MDNFVTIVDSFVTELQESIENDILYPHTIHGNNTKLCTRFKISPVSRGAC